MPYESHTLVLIASLAWDARPSDFQELLTLAPLLGKQTASAPEALRPCDPPRDGHAQWEPQGQSILHWQPAGLKS